MKEEQKHTDPVCGMSVAPGASAGQSEYGNQVWSFCSQHCLDKFEAGPDAYVTSCGHIKPQEEKHHHEHDGGHENHVAESEKEVGGQYICPMCPDVRATKPASCPRCGMALEPEMPAGTTRTEYVCPMHPEVVSNEPGSCPKCGMALEPGSRRSDWVPWRERTHGRVPLHLPG